MCKWKQSTKKPNQNSNPLNAIQTTSSCMLQITLERQNPTETAQMYDCKMHDRKKVLCLGKMRQTYIEGIKSNEDCTAHQCPGTKVVDSINTTCCHGNRSREDQRSNSSGLKDALTVVSHQIHQLCINGHKDGSFLLLTQYKINRPKSNPVQNQQSKFKPSTKSAVQNQTQYKINRYKLFHQPSLTPSNYQINILSTHRQLSFTTPVPNQHSMNTQT